MSFLLFERCASLRLFVCAMFAVAAAFALATPVGADTPSAGIFTYDEQVRIGQTASPELAHLDAPVVDLAGSIAGGGGGLGYVYDLSPSFVAPSGLLDNFADVGSGASLIRRVDVDGVPVSIKSGHGYRPDHGSVDITGVLGRDAVDSAVATDLATRVNTGTSVTRAGSGHSTFQTAVGGHTVEYRAVFVPATGRYEVGTY